VNKYIVITTINSVTESIKAFGEHKDWQTILVGDKKSVAITDVERREFLSVEKQTSFDFEFMQLCPFNHYARKNIGYLYAISKGADVIYDTDDDNKPLENWVTPVFDAEKVVSVNSTIVNIYRIFTDKHVWPRGYPLAKVLADEKPVLKSVSAKIGVWQGLANGEPDVDAIYRLIVGNKVTFDSHAPVAVEKGVYCPFNSQNTFWNKKAFPLLYLPVTVSFRYTDILRGFVAQRILWEHDMLLGFTEATVYQDRNIHNLMKDFEQEISMYVGFDKLLDVFARFKTTGEMSTDLIAVYSLLAEAEIVAENEIPVVQAWVRDLEKICA
jgi:hypothetical protein